MRYCVLTLFPEMVEAVTKESILGRASRKGCISIDTINIRDFSTDKNGRVDDYPYGGSAGMVIEAEPVFQSIKKAKEMVGENSRVIYLTPQAKVLSQTKVEELSREESLILLCGHYEGIDERVLEETVTDYISVGDYVLTGGELASLVLIDAVSRFVPGVLGNQESKDFESLQDNLLEYPHYTRPEVWHGKRVPSVLLSGNHQDVDQWRFAQSLERTSHRRPDLMEKSFTFYIGSYGSHNCLSVAEEFSKAISRYGRLLDFKRSKIRHEKITFSKRDVFILFADEEPKENTFKGITKNDAITYIFSHLYYIDILGKHKISKNIPTEFFLDEEGKPLTEKIMREALIIRQELEAFKR